MLEKIAIGNGFKGFYATVLEQNKGMLQVFKKRYPEARFQKIGAEVEVVMDFAR
jgi:hypothetical protein